MEGVGTLDVPHATYVQESAAMPCLACDELSPEILRVPAISWPAASKEAAQATHAAALLPPRRTRVKPASVAATHGATR